MIGLVAGLILAEAVLSIVDVRPERYPQPKWSVAYGGTFHELGMWGGGLIKREHRFADQGIVMGEYVPGATFKVVYGNKRGEFDEADGVVMRINSQGFRGPEVSVGKNAGTWSL